MCQHLNSAFQAVQSLKILRNGLVKTAMRKTNANHLVSKHVRWSMWHSAHTKFRESSLSLATVSSSISKLYPIPCSLVSQKSDWTARIMAASVIAGVHESWCHAVYPFMQMFVLVSNRPDSVSNCMFGALYGKFGGRIIFP